MVPGQKRFTFNHHVVVCGRNYLALSIFWEARNKSKVLHTHNDSPRAWKLGPIDILYGLCSFYERFVCIPNDYAFITALKQRKMVSFLLIHARLQRQWLYWYYLPGAHITVACASLSLQKMFHQYRLPIPYQPVFKKTFLHNDLSLRAIKRPGEPPSSGHQPVPIKKTVNRGNAYQSSSNCHLSNKGLRRSNRQHLRPGIHRYLVRNMFIQPTNLSFRFRMHD